MPLHGSKKANVDYDGVGPIASRPAAGEAGRTWYATDTGVTWLDDGSAWQPLTAGFVVTSLPGSPVNGQECNFHDATNNVVWRLKYRSAAAGSYKWDVIGGPPLLAQANPAGQAAASGAHLPLALPLAGDYLVDSGIRVQHDTWPFAARLNVFKPGGSVLVSADTAWLALTGGSGFTRATATEKAVATALATGTYIGDTENLGNNPSVFGIWMQFTPLRVG